MVKKSKIDTYKCEARTALSTLDGLLVNQQKGLAE